MSNSELVAAVPQLVAEAVNNIGSDRVNLEALMTQGESKVMETLFQQIPKNDTDREGWVKLLALGYLGYLDQQGFSLDDTSTQEKVTDVLRNQLQSDYNRWGDTWKKGRWVKGQAERTVDKFRDYKEIHDNGINQELPWSKVMGNLVINITRLDHPEYQAKV